MKKRAWLIAAVLLMAVAAGLMFYGEKEQPPPPRVEVKFPRKMRGQDLDRMQKRRVLPAPLPAAIANDSSQPKPIERPRDPLLAALTASARGSAVVIEANAIRHSPVGQLLIDCLSTNPRGNPLEKVKEKAGVDLLQDVDRVAVMDEGLVVSGNFGKAKFEELQREGFRPTFYGDKATIYEPEPQQNADGTMKDRGEYVVSWGDQLIMVANSAEAARAVVDQVEGRAPAKPSILNENQTYGEIYGVLSTKDLALMLPEMGAQRDLAQQLKDAADTVELHVDTSQDVGLVADVKGPNADKIRDLGKSIGAAMSMARMQAQANGEKEVAALLDLARVHPDDGKFKMEMAMPLQMLEKQLGICRHRNQANSAAKPATP
jgi:hypothetical protein